MSKFSLYLGRGVALCPPCSRGSSFFTRCFLPPLFFLLDFLHRSFNLLRLRSIGPDRGYGRRRYHLLLGNGASSPCLRYRESPGRCECLCILRWMCKACASCTLLFPLCKLSGFCPLGLCLLYLTQSGVLCGFCLIIRTNDRRRPCWFGLGGGRGGMGRRWFGN